MELKFYANTMTIYLWFLFIISCIITIIPLIAFWVQWSEDGEDARGASYVPIFSCLLSGLILLTGQYVLSASASRIVWFVANGIIVVSNFVACVLYARRSFHFAISFLLVLLLGLYPVLSHTRFEIDQNLFNSISFEGVITKRTVIIGAFSFLIGVLIPLIIANIRLRRKALYRVHANSVVFPSDYKTMKELLNEQSRQMQKSMRTITESIEQMKLQSLLMKYPGGNDNKADAKIGNVLAKMSEDVRIIKCHARQFSVSQITVDESTLVREISHFMATPLATIDASFKTLTAYAPKGKDKAKWDELSDRVLSSITMCNGIIATYRSIFADESYDDNKKLSALIQSSFEVFQKEEKKDLKLMLKVNDTHQDIRNYYIISLVLPILSNAVTAAKPNTSIEVTENKGKIKITNTYEGTIDLTNFEKEGYSSKNNHRGMGLYTVRHLLSRRDLGELNYYLDGKRIVFEIPIQKTEEDE